MTTRGIKAFAAAALTATALLAAGCGDDDSTTATDTTAVETTATTAEETTATVTDETTAPSEDGGEIDAAVSSLESAGFDVREEPDGDLDTVTGTAQAGVVVTQSGTPGDALVFEWADAEEADAYAKANNDDVLTTEVVGNLTVTSVTSNTDMLDDVLAAIGG